MSISTRNRRFSYLGTFAVAAIALLASALPLAPAKAQAWVQLGPLRFGVGAPAPAYTYPYYPPYGYGYYYPYYPHYYGY
ncbi:MAG TPA: hypothetical protein VE687_18145 [Stellaceae bacterium]|nr:hypothetical protein [Stellaceae bacterium]